MTNGIKRIFSIVFITGAMLCVSLVAAQPVLLSDNAGASDKDSATKIAVKRSDPKSMFLADWLDGKDTFYRWDSSFGYVQRYNHAQRSGLPYTDLGVNASPQKILLMDPFARVGYQTGLNQYPLQNRDPDKMVFYKAAVPFTRFSYVQGGNGFFILDGLHTQNLSPNWNLTVDFTSAQNGELYTASKQSNLHRGIMLGSNFTNRKGNYQNIIIATWNRGRRSENYGILPETDTLFFTQKGKHSSFTPSYYPSSGTSSSIFSSSHHVLMQKLFLDPAHNIYLYQRMDWKKEKYFYKETDNTPDSVFYGKNYIFHPGAFADSAVWLQWNNEFGIGNAVKRSSNFPLLWKMFYSTNRIEYNSVYKLSPNIYFNQGVHGVLQWNPYHISTLNLTAKGDYYLAGYNAGDYKLTGDVAWNQKNIFISAGIKSQAYAAPYYTTVFATNYRLNMNDFGKVKVNAIHGSIAFKNKFLNAYANMQTGNADNYIYTDSACNFKQTSGLAFVTFQGGLNLHLGHFYMDHKFTVQTQNKTSIIPVPKYSELLSVYYEGFLFKKAMYARMGADIWIMGAYTGYAYNPELAAFYPTAQKAGNYPVADVFFSGQVKTVQFFVKMEHVNQRATNYGFNPRYYSAIGYPMEPLRLRLGLAWKFYN